MPRTLCGCVEAKKCPGSATLLLVVIEHETEQNVRVSRGHTWRLGQHRVLSASLEASDVLDASFGLHTRRGRHRA